MTFQEIQNFVKNPETTIDVEFIEDLNIQKYKISDEDYLDLVLEVLLENGVEEDEYSDFPTLTIPTLKKYLLEIVI